MLHLAALNDQFAIPGVAEIIADRGGLPAVWIEGQDGYTGLVYLHGAHVAAWRPKDHEELLWLSEKSAWQNDKPIRGGVPICFPWFGPRKDAPPSPPAPASPAHGFARLLSFTLDAITRSVDGITVSLSLKSSPDTRAIWPHDFLLRHHITFGKQLTLALELTNTGATNFTAEQALHTYFSVGDVRKVRITGLQNTAYIDKTDNAREREQAGDITITAETDRVYVDTTAPVAFEDPAKNRRITIAKQNSLNTVVWNPWIAKAKAMPDFGDEEWHTMLCVETCNVGPSAVTLPPNDTHTMTAVISVESL